MTPSNHSPEAIAWRDYSNADSEADEPSFLAGMRAGVAATHAQQYAATEDTLTTAIYVGERTGFWLTEEDSRQIARALLASPGPLLDAAEVRREVIRETRSWVRAEVGESQKLLDRFDEYFPTEGAKP